MRQRKVKDLETKMQAVSDWLVKNPAPGVWQKVFAGGQIPEHDTGSVPEQRSGCGSKPEPMQETGRALYLEIGCGRGDFLLQQALAHPENDYIGIEGQDSVVLRAMEKAAKVRDGHVSEEDPEWMRVAAGADANGAVETVAGVAEPEAIDCPEMAAGAAESTGASILDNIRFACAFVNGLDELFDPGILAGIYLNFSDPWPKARHAKRRLTYRGRLQDYARALQPGGFIAIKTDNDGLFAFTLEEIEACGWTPAALTWDLHRTGNGDTAWNPSGNDADGTGAVCGIEAIDGIGAVSGTRAGSAEEDQPLQEARQPMTEYEKKFHAAGKPIHYVKVVI